MKFISLLVGLSLIGPLLPAQGSDRQITIVAGKSAVIDSPGDVERVAVATDDIVEAVAVTQREVVLNAKAPGETTVIIWQRNGGGRQSYDVAVKPSPLETRDTSPADARRSRRFSADRSGRQGDVPARVGKDPD